MMISRHCRRSVSAGLRRCYTRGGARDWGAAMGGSKEGTKGATNIAGLGANCQSNSISAPN